MDKINIYICSEDNDLVDKTIKSLGKKFSQAEVAFRTYNRKEQFIKEIGGNTQNFKITILADHLTVREAPTALSRAVCYVKRDEVYTITVEHEGWGKLLSGVGWISLSSKYVRRNAR